MTFKDRMRLAKAAEGAGKADQAYQEYCQALALDPTQVEAWLGKARTIGLRASWRELPLDDISAALAGAVEHAPPGREREVRAAAAALLRDVAIAHQQRSTQRLDDYVSARGEWRGYLERCVSVVRALEHAHALDPTDPVALEKIVEVCAGQIEGVVYNDVGDYQIVTQRRHGITQGYEAELRQKIADCAAKLRALRPGYVAPQVKKRELDEKGACFVVTAAMGDAHHPDVVAIRRWRDETLARTAAGRLLMEAYQVVGPGAARVVRRSPALRRLSRALLVRPLAAALRKLAGRGRRPGYLW
jgi:hypothetical protein